MAASCEITVTGFPAHGGGVPAIASFSFTPQWTVLGTVPLIHAVLPSRFKRVGKVDIVENSPLTQALILDNLHYVVS